MEEALKNFENQKRKEEEQDIKNIDKILDVNLPDPIAQTKIYYKNSWKWSINRRIWSWILEISIYKLLLKNTYNSKTNTFYCFQYSIRWKNWWKCIWSSKNWTEKTRKRFYEDKPFKEGDKERCTSRIEEAEGRENLYKLAPKWKSQRHQKLKIWILNIVCKV